jgi:purine-binding chemotaxis protein CheW
MAQSTQAGTEKYLTFFLHDEEYGLRITSVQEIIRRLPVTSVPNSAPYVLGLINLRGRVLPVIDLAVRLGMPAVTPAPRNCIVVVRAGTQQLGLLNDRMNEVVELQPNQIEPTPEFGTPIDRELLRGVAKYEDRVILLLDAEHVVAPHTRIS